MLLARNGHKPSDVGLASSMLLYINKDTVNAIHVAPPMRDMRSLIQQRNTFCSDAKRAAKPRGVELCYDKENEHDSPK